MNSAKSRYLNDVVYKRVVDCLERMIDEAQLSPAEMREAAILASINYEMKHIRQFHIPITGNLQNALEELHELINKAKP